MYCKSKRILIQSDGYDRSTNDVLDWLYFLGDTEPVRLNGDIDVDTIIISAEGVSLKNESKALSIPSANDAYWYRRGSFRLSDSNTEVYDYNRKIILNGKRLVASLPIELLGKEHIGAYSDNLKIKLHNLIIANQCGIKVPLSIFTNESRELEIFRGKKYLMKNISNETIEIEINNQFLCELTYSNKLVAPDALRKSQRIAAGCQPAFFQEYIEKKYELRIFYLNGEFFSMAIFSQQNEKTRLDFRNYDGERPNRNVPFKLPASIETKAELLMKSIGMNCGSIDMIYTPENEYVFLEVNPIGQYQWLEGNCNYPISKTIAQTLRNEYG